MKSIQLLKKIIIDKLLPVGLLAAAVFIFDIQCPIQTTFGIPCPGCNMTTALYYLLHGDIKSAWFFHPAVFLLMVSMIIVLVLQLFQKENGLNGCYM